MSDSDDPRSPTGSVLADMLAEAAHQWPQAPALGNSNGTGELSYRTLRQLCDRLATQLATAGLQPGQPVLLAAHNTSAYVIALFGAARAGMVIAPIDPTLPDSEIDLRARQLGARAVLTDRAPGSDTPYPRIEVVVNDSTVSATLIGPLRPAADVVSDLATTDALVMFTAGTTGRPKMVPMTQGNVAASIDGICATYNFGPRDRTLAVMPFFHGHGLFAVLLATFAAGGRITLPGGGKFSAHSFWDELIAAGATWMTAVPTMYEICLRRAIPAPGSLPALRFLRSCSAPLTDATAARLSALFNAPVIPAYGMTESCHQVAAEPIPQGAPPLGSVGFATSGDELAISEHGEVLVRGATVARGYLGDPAKTAQAWHDGWLHTGDLGRLDADGRLYLTGRIKNVINRGGEKISPEHIEDAISAIPGVLEVAAFGVPDPILGERVAVAVVPATDSLTETEVADGATTRLARFEVPETILFVESLPHTAKGALDRAAITARFGHR